MSQWKDISLPLCSDLAAWPGSSPFRLERTKRIEVGEPANVSRLECEVHFGTHIDAPLHYLQGGKAVDELSLEAMIGPVTVINLSDCKKIDAALLDAQCPAIETQRLLVRTSNSQLWAKGEKRFCPDYVALTQDAALWLVERGIRLLGVDYLSVQRFGEGPEVHRTLLQAGIVLLEGLNLDGVATGDYELVCLPLNLVGAEGAPARAVLRPMSTASSSGESV